MDEYFPCVTIRIYGNSIRDAYMQDRLQINRDAEVLDNPYLPLKVYITYEDFLELTFKIESYNK